MPDLQQVGALVYTNAKDGMDVGEIAHGKPIGVRATKDKSAVYAMDADVVLYTPMIVDPNDMCAILATGKHFITLSGRLGQETKNGGFPFCHCLKRSYPSATWAGSTGHLVNVG